MTPRAVFEMVHVIVGDSEPYCGGIIERPGASPEVAAIAAAHGALVALHPARALALDALQTTALTAIPHGQAKDHGIAVGQAAGGRRHLTSHRRSATVSIWRPQPGQLSEPLGYRT